jgi:hypothetical protein
MEYIQTHARLTEVALEKLGEMKPGTTYAQFMQQAREIAAQRGVTNPKLMLAMLMKPETTNSLSVTDLATGASTEVRMPLPTEMVYPIADFEWSDFMADIPTYCTVNPTVWVVDGTLYTAPI